MPKWSNAAGEELYADDACRTCAIFDLCNVHTDLRFDGIDSKWNEKHIVKKGDAPKGVKDYIECESYTEYVPPSKRPIDPDFGLRISDQEAGLRDE